MHKVAEVYPTYELGEVVDIKGDDYIFNGRFLQRLRGRDMFQAIQTLSGVFFWPLDAHISEPRVVDMAHQISIESRFANTPPYPYSVAWHSYALSHVVPDHLKKWALIHDVTEAYLIDLPRPIKRVEPFKTEYERIERNLMVVLSEYLEMEERAVPEELHYWDTLMGNCELITLMGDIGLAKIRILRPDDYLDYAEECKKFSGWIREMHFADARDAWLTRFEQLFGITAEEFDIQRQCPKLEL